MFSPQEVPKLSTRVPPLVLKMPENGPAPWQREHPLWRERPLPPGKAWQFTVYGGLFEIDKVRDELVRVFGNDHGQSDGRRAGTTATFAFTLDAHGSMVENSAVLSACAWAISRLRSPGPGDLKWLDGFDDDNRGFVTSLNKLSPPEIAAAEERSALAAEVGDRARSAALDAIAKGAGAAATAAATAGATMLGGPVLGGIAGTVAGTFAEKLLERRKAEKSSDPDQDDAEPPTLNLTVEDVYRLVKKLGDGLGITAALGVDGVQVRCAQVSARYAGESTEQDFLNSFIAQDLAVVEQAVRRGDVGEALRDYLSDDCAVESRIDVRARPDAVIAGVEPHRIPGGRWPGAVSKPLVLGQQFAVDQLMTEIGDSTGIFAVNGPPGTGKTTMLRDVLAAIVTERAIRLSKLENPRAAFTAKLETAQIGRYRPTVYGIRPELTGFEIVVATASNDAAANVTAEIPAISAVSGVQDEALAADYFSDLASGVLDRKAWGLVAAVLGNMSNRSEFVSRFWWGDNGSRNRPSEPGTDDEGGAVEPIGMMRMLQQAVNEPATVPDWEAAVTAFDKAHDEVRRLTDERQSIADAINNLERLQTVINTAAQDIIDTQNEYDSWRNRHSQATFARAQDEAAVSAANIEIDRHHARKPGFWISLSTWFKAGRVWHARHLQLLADLEAKQSTLGTRNAEIAQCARAWESAAAKGRALVHTHAAAVAEHQLASRVITDAQERWSAVIPFGEILTDEKRFQLCSPWADAEFTAARHRLFLEALRLHKAFILGSGSLIRGNLDVAMAAIRNQLDVKPKPATLATAWQTLFFVVPMVSTTFASLPRLFTGLGRETFGWLFIDEAGQATPQLAVGGLWRAKRAVIVGDPQQLEPIVTLPISAQHALLRQYRLGEQWTPDYTSAQRVADRLARHGTSLPEPDGDADVWVGAPLRVHRRCDRPMFEISNRIAYGGDLMVYGTMHEGEFTGANTWFDISSEVAEDKWVPAEGDQLRHLLILLTNGVGIAPEHIRVISPFRDVVRGSKSVAAEAIHADFARSNVGTVHTVQGQEADVVILVLGTGPRQVGARRWAAEKPNLLNVAVSRAKRRIYVIGNHQSWRNQRYFDVLAASLHRSSVPPS
ncbi:AAA domain-containing protein [Nocardia sp. NBC_01503]|uniref:AAA domain-containing protein n=1 Tax=Nocardia sp. NBC_01503 TaxID=2975997 RepID=UPI002E7B72F6|nr:AAA domain-containing protein [Nocardia sp. NBC_01503]WTL32691.1 AAA domain-containing protein [Nocardia sp. NBC_01503]